MVPTSYLQATQSHRGVHAAGPAGTPHAPLTHRDTALHPSPGDFQDAGHRGNWKQTFLHVSEINPARGSQFLLYSGSTIVRRRPNSC